MANVYSDELLEIRRKSRLVYQKRGIYPFLDVGPWDLKYKSGSIPGYQIFSLWSSIPGIVDEKNEE